MTLEIRSLPGPFGVQIDVADGQRIDRLSEADRRSLREAFAQHSVVLIRGISLEPRSHVDLTLVLGEPEIHPVKSIRLAGHPEIIEVVHTPDMGVDDSGSADPDELVGELHWHADLMYMREPSHGALLRALEIPAEGGETAFVDTTLAYDHLDESMKRELIDMRAVYRFTGDGFRARNKHVEKDGFFEVLHPLVHRVPDTEKLALSISPAAIRIDGLEAEQSQRTIQDLQRHATQKRFTYVHRWQVGDLIVYNNLRALHSARGHKRRYRRVLHRTTLRGRPLEPVGHTAGALS